MELHDLAAVPGPGIDLAAWSTLVRPEPFVVSLDDPPDADAVDAAGPLLRAMPTVVVLVGDPEDAPPALLDAVDVAVTDRPDPPRPWVHARVEDLADAVGAQPAAAMALAALLRMSAELPVWNAVAAESSTYAMLLRSSPHAAWLADRPPTDGPLPLGRPAVRTTRRGDRLLVELDRPEVHNAVDSSLRDALVEALALPAADPSITDIDLRGRGRSFSSGGDLREFGAVDDGATAFAVRLARHPGLAVHGIAGRTTVHLQGACIGAGIEMAAFAARVVADAGVAIRLPEMAMGLVPGAGGTVSVSRRVGRHRSAWLALTGTIIDASTALAWGLVDEVRRMDDWPT